MIHALVSNLAIYYFNIPLHFFEPFLEPVTIEIEYGVIKKQRFRALEIIVSENVLNVNLPITLYECTAAFFNEIMITIQNIKQEEGQEEEKESHHSELIESEKDEEELKIEEELKDEELKKEEAAHLDSKEEGKGEDMADASEMIQELDPYYLANNYTSQSVSQKY